MKQRQLIQSAVKRSGVHEKGNVNGNAFGGYDSVLGKRERND